MMPRQKNDRLPVLPVSDRSAARNGRKKRAKRLLDPKTGRVPEKPVPQIAHITSVRIRKKKKTKAEKAEAKKRHAIDKAELDKMRRRTKILSLREQGASIRQISEQLISQGEEGCSPTSVYEHLCAALEDLTEKYTLTIKHNVQLQVNKLERVELAHLRRLCDPSLDPDDVEKLSRAMERVWKRYDSLLGLNKPAKVEVSGENGTPIESTIRVIMPVVVNAQEGEA